MADNEKISLHFKVANQENFVSLESRDKLLPVTAPAIVDINPYYRSRLFNTNAGKNPFVNAAAPVLTTLGKLKRHNFDSELSTLQELFIHEVRAFENKLQDRGYRNETILAGRYAICVTIDDLITHFQHTDTSKWKQFSILKAFQSEEDEGKRFFMILSRIQQHPYHYIDLMELMYHCLSIGFTGVYRENQNGKEIVDELMDELYHNIRAIRGDHMLSFSNYKKKIHKNTSPLKFYIGPVRFLHDG